MGELLTINGSNEGMGGKDSPPEKEAMTVDVTEEEVKNFKVGDPVEMIVKGTIGMAQVPPPDMADFGKPKIGIIVDSKKINGVTAEKKMVDEMMDDSDDT